MKKILLTFLLCPSLAFAAPLKIPALKLCLNNSTGAISAKQKCKGAETLVSQNNLAPLFALQGPQGPAGMLNVNSCYSKHQFQGSTNGGFTDFFITCNAPSTDFMLSDSFDYSPFAASDVYLQRRKLIFQNGEQIPVGVQVSAGTLDAQPFTGVVSIVCCPR